MQNFYLVSYYISEVFHTFFLLVFIYTLYLILTKKYTPYSNIYAGIYFGAHAAYNGCPLTSFQNLLAQRAGLDMVENIFLRTDLGELSFLLRLLSVFFTTVLFYNSYAIFKKFNIKAKYWLHFWLERKMHTDQFSVGMVFDEKKEDFVVLKNAN